MAMERKQRGSPRHRCESPQLSPAAGTAGRAAGAREGEPGFGARPAPRGARQGAEGLTSSGSAMVNPLPSLHCHRVILQIDVSDSWSAVRLELASKCP